MDRNNIIGALLITIIIIGWGVWSNPSKEEMAKRKKYNDSIATLTPTKTTTSLIDTAVKSEIKKTNLPPNDIIQSPTETKFFHLENELIKVDISSKGGYPTSVILNDYLNQNKEPLQLVKNNNLKIGFYFPIKNQILNTEDIQFSEVFSSKDSLTLKITTSENKSLFFNYSLKPNNYSLNFNIDFGDFNTLIPENVSFIDFNAELLTYHNEINTDLEKKATSIAFLFSNKDYEILEGSDPELSKKLETKTKWIGFKQQFFSILFIANNEFDKSTQLKSISLPENSETYKKLSLNIPINYNHALNEKFGFDWYFGPNKYLTLKTLNVNAENIVDLGWSLIRPVSEYLIIPLFSYLSTFDINMGIIILILTLIIKLALFPLSYRSYISMAKMKVLKPQVEEIQKKYKKEESLKSQQEVMAFYRKVGVSPLGGCFPQLLQFPFLVSLFYFFPSSIELRQESFLWAKDLSSFDNILNLPFNIPFYGNHISLFTFLMAISNYLYMKFNSSSSTNTSNEMMAMQMKIMQYIFPVLMLVWFNSYSSGLTYYYLLTNIISIIQHFLIKKYLVDEVKLLAKIEKTKEKNKNKPKSNFQKRLEEMANKRRQK